MSEICISLMPHAVNEALKKKNPSIFKTFFLNFFLIWCTILLICTSCTMMKTLLIFFLPTILFGQVFEMCRTDVLIVTFP